jgi:thioredoxin reductase
MASQNFDRVVIGGGIFGIYSALILAEKGFSTLIVEQDSQLMNRASKINQARLHTGLHYPRSLLTAQESKKNYERFNVEFGESVRHFDQIYAVSSKNSKTSAKDFRKFQSNLATNIVEVDPNEWFFRNTVDAAFKVEEPTFDSEILKSILMNKVSKTRIEVWVNTRVDEIIEINENKMRLLLSSGVEVIANKIVIASYASINNLREKMRLIRLPLSYEITEVVLGNVGQKLANIGFTIMDGPFWSMMPFGNTGLVSLTSVGLTPTLRSEGSPIFSCQELNKSCSPSSLQLCDFCTAKPKSMKDHQIQQMKMFLKDYEDFNPIKSMYTIKTILRTTQVDDGRPTFVSKEMNNRLVTVFSGKISTIFDLDKELD